MKELTLVGLASVYGIAWYREFTNNKSKQSIVVLLTAQAGAGLILLTLADFSPSLAFAFTLLLLLSTILGIGIQSGKTNVNG